MIKVRYSAVDGYRARTHRFATLAGAQRYAHERVGAHPEVGCGYAVSGDGVGRVRVEGCTLAALFPDEATPQLSREDNDYISREDAAEIEAERYFATGTYYRPQMGPTVPRQFTCTCSSYQLQQVGCDCHHHDEIPF